MSTAPERSARYLRESAMQAAAPDRYGIPVQRDLCARYEEEAGYQHVAEYVDAGADSAKLYRPALTALRRDMAAHRFDVLVIARYDRLARDQALQNFLWYEATTVYGVRVEFADPSENFDDSAEGWLLRGVKGYVSQKARETIRKSTQAARRARAQSGKLIPGPKALYGYQWADANKTRWLINEEEAAIVRRCARDVLAGLSLHAIAAALTAEGVPLPSGQRGEWQHNTVRRLLRKAEYVGRHDAYGTTTVEREHILSDGMKVSTRVPVPRPADAPERVPMPEGVVPPILDAATWDAVQTALDRNKTTSARRNADPDATLLRGGIALCGTCGRPLHAVRMKQGLSEQQKQRGRRRHAPAHWAYACTHADCLHRASIYAHTLDSAAWRLLKAEVMPPERVAELEEGWQDDQQQREQEAAADVRAVTNRASALDADIERLTGRIAREEDERIVALYRVELGKLMDERERLADLVSDAQETYQRVAALANHQTTFNAWLAQVRTALARSDLPRAEQRLLFHGFQVRVLVWPRDHHPRWMLVMGFDRLVADALAAVAPSEANKHPLPVTLQLRLRSPEPFPDLTPPVLAELLEPALGWQPRHLLMTREQPGRRLDAEKAVALVEQMAALTAVTVAAEAATAESTVEQTRR